MAGVQMIAKLEKEDLTGFYPITNLYSTSDGKWFLVTVKTTRSVAILAEMTGTPISLSHASRGVEVFLSNASGVVIDYDGDPANGLTPIISTDSGSFASTIIPELETFEDALKALGYTTVTSAA